MFTLSIRKQGQKFLYKSKKSRYTTMISHVNRNESNNLNTPNSDNILGTSKFSHSNIQNYGSFNTTIPFKKVSYTESSVSINDERTDKKYITEKNASHQNPSEIIEHTFDYNGINLVNT